MSTAEVRRKVQMDGLGAEDELCLPINWVRVAAKSPVFAKWSSMGLLTLGLPHPLP